MRHCRRVCCSSRAALAVTLRAATLFLGQWRNLSLGCACRGSIRAQTGPLYGESQFQAESLCQKPVIPWGTGVLTHLRFFFWREEMATRISRKYPFLPMFSPIEGRSTSMMRRRRKARRNHPYGDGGREGVLMAESPGEVGLLTRQYQVTSLPWVKQGKTHIPA